MDSGDYLLLQKEIPNSVNLLAAKYAKSKGKIVILDCGGRDEPLQSDLLANLDYISPNETELLRIDPDIDVSNPV